MAGKQSFTFLHTSRRTEGHPTVTFALTAAFLLPFHRTERLKSVATHIPSHHPFRLHVTTGYHQYMNMCIEWIPAVTCRRNGPGIK